MTLLNAYGLMSSCSATIDLNASASAMTSCRDAAAGRCRRVRRYALSSAGVEHTSRLVPARYRGQGDPPDLQRFMAERVNSTIVEVLASHVLSISQPAAASELVVRADGEAAVAALAYASGGGTLTRRTGRLCEVRVVVDADRRSISER